ncbi:hypothetical protein [Pyrobaculum sp.]
MSLGQPPTTGQVRAAAKGPARPAGGYFAKKAGSATPKRPVLIAARLV